MYRDVLEAHPRPHEMVALAELLIATGAAEEGRTWLGRAEQVWVDRLDRGDVSVRRELAMLWLDHGGDEARALELARADLTLRKDALAYDTLAWALHRNGQRGEAEKAMRTAMQYGTRMRVLSEHAQAILGG
jgi:hypothetical protein